MTVKPSHEKMPKRSYCQVTARSALAAKIQHRLQIERKVILTGRTTRVLVAPTSSSVRTMELAVPFGAWSPCYSPVCMTLLWRVVEASIGR